MNQIAHMKTSWDGTCTVPSIRRAHSIYIPTSLTEKQEPIVGLHAGWTYIDYCAMDIPHVHKTTRMVWYITASCEHCIIWSGHHPQPCRCTLRYYPYGSSGSAEANTSATIRLNAGPSRFLNGDVQGGSRGVAATVVAQRGEGGEERGSIRRGCSYSRA